MKKITVLIADDHTIVRQGLKHLIEMADDIEVVGEADNGETVLKEAKRLLPDVILLDIAMPKSNGIESARRLCKDVPASKILMLSTYHDDQEVHLAIAAGATGYLMKETAGGDLLRAIRETHKGNAFFSPEISRRILRQTREAFQNGADRKSGSPTLTDRETQVLRLISDGKSNKEIAEALQISVKTVEKHRQTLMNKLHVHDAAGLTRYAIARGLIPCERPSLVRPPETEPAAAGG
jgi:DNA-binding NarL/FixJ family response regulator